MHQAEKLHRLRNALQRANPEIDALACRRHVEGRRCRGGDHNLPAPGARHYTRRAVRGSLVDLPNASRSAMNADPDVETSDTFPVLGLKRALQVERAPHGTAGTENRKYAVT